ARTAGQPTRKLHAGEAEANSWYPLWARAAGRSGRDSLLCAGGETRHCGALDGPLVSQPSSHPQERMSFFGIPNPRNVALLAVSQGFFMCVQSMAIATTPLAGYALPGVVKAPSTLRPFLTHAGVTMATTPASFLMARIGRRGGFSVGAMCGIASGLISRAAILLQSFVLLCVGSLFQGMAAA